MTAVIRCECGWESSAASTDDAVVAMRDHVVGAHPDLGAPPAPADLRAMVEECSGSSIEGERS